MSARLFVVTDSKLVPRVATTTTGPAAMVVHRLARLRTDGSAQVGLQPPKILASTSAETALWFSASLATTVMTITT